MAHDQRRVLVSLTPKTRKIAQQLIPRQALRSGVLARPAGRSWGAPQ